MSTKSNQLKIGSVLSYVQMALSIVIGIVYTPVMIRLLGQSEYGLYNVVSSTVSMLSLLSLGFNAGYVRYYTGYKRKDDKDSIAKLNGLFLLIFSFIGIVALVCGIFLSNNLNYVFADGLTAKEYEIAKVLMLLLTVNMAVSFPASVFTSIISANEQFIFLKLIGAIKTVVSPLVTLPLLLAGYGSIAMVTVTLSISLVVDSIHIFYVVRRLKQKFIFRNFEKGIIRSLGVYTFFIAINMVVDQVNNNIGKLMLGRYRGTAETAIYAVGYNLYQYYSMFSTSISGVFTPRIHSLVQSTKSDIDKQKKALTALFTKVGRIQFSILSLIAMGVIFFGRPFILNFWVGEGYEVSYIVAVVLILSSSIALIQNLGIEIQRAENNHQFRSVAYLIMACVNLGLSVVLCPKYGAAGSAIGTAISLIIANGFIMNIYYHKKCNIDIIYFWKSILRMSMGLIPPAVCGIVIMKYISMQNILVFIAMVLVYCVVHVTSLWLLSFNAEEKELIKRPISRITHRH